jgi:hypothetical protein
VIFIFCQAHGVITKLIIAHVFYVLTQKLDIIQLMELYLHQNYDRFKPFMGFEYEARCKDHVKIVVIGQVAGDISTLFATKYVVGFDLMPG